MADAVPVHLGYLGRSLPPGGADQASLWLSRIGGSPAWPAECRRRPGRPPTGGGSSAACASAAGDGSLLCRQCGAALALVGQFAAGYDSAPRRTLHVFGCTSGACGASDPGAWRAIRSVGSVASPAAPTQQDAAAAAPPGGGDDWGVPAASDDWGAPASDDWGAAGDDWGAAPAAGADDADAEIDALLQARAAKAATGVAGGGAAGARAAAPAADEADAEEDAWPAVVDAAAADVWPCLALQIYEEPAPWEKSGEHEKELLERYLKSGLADEDDGGGGDKTAGIPAEMLAELCTEEQRMKADAEADEDEMDADEQDADIGGSQSDWLTRFQRRLERSPLQVMRYAWGGEALWMAPPPKELASGSWPPPCGRCGAARIFELQLLPTLLSRIRASWPEGGAELNMDWGTVVVYTCEQDCAGEDPCEEFVVVQASV